MTQSPLADEDFVQLIGLELNIALFHSYSEAHRLPDAMGTPLAMGGDLLC